MLRVKKSNRRKRTVLLAASVIGVLLLLSGIIYLVFRPVDPEQAASRDSQTNKSDEFIPEPTHQDPGAQQEGVPDIETSNESPSSAAFPTTQPNLAITIESATQTGSNLRVNAKIEPNAKGSCTLRLSRGGQTAIEHTVAADGSTCTMTVNVSGLTKGEWTATTQVMVESNVATSSRLIIIK